MYVTVADVDEAAKRAEALGAKVLAPPFEVMDAGRMAVLQDPTGAVFQVWQATKHIGAKILNEPGALCWSELTTRDTKAAESFYTKLFGWTQTCGACNRFTTHHTRAFYDVKGQAEGRVCSGCGYVSKVERL